jgi:hypothetical protein
MAGAFAGIVHVLSGPDHLAAVAPLVPGVRYQGSGFSEVAGSRWHVGLIWGLGHTSGVLLIGLLLIAFRSALPLEAISAYSERLVGIALVALGIWAALRARDFHRHGDRPHAHPGGRASFAMGALHGLAGSSHLFGVLPALALPTEWAALAYLGGFGLGAVAAMTAFAAIVGALAVRTGRRSTRHFGTMLYACSFSAFVVGGFWLIG